jgi:hypothetical protein
MFSNRDVHIPCTSSGGGKRGYLLIVGRIEVSGPQGEAFQIYANQGAKICNSFIGFIQGMGGGMGRVHCVIYNDPDRLFDYLLTSGIGDVAVAVAGWFI